MEVWRPGCILMILLVGGIKGTQLGVSGLGTCVDIDGVICMGWSSGLVYTTGFNTDDKRL